MSLRWLTAGESHGPLLVGILDGLPAGVPVVAQDITTELRRRQQGYGRGGRMKIEQDAAQIVAGVRHGRSTGAPIALLIPNRDHANWLPRLQIEPLEPGASAGPRVTLPRPGHADLAGMLKYDTPDGRDVLERASARETATRTALAAVARSLLDCLDIHVGSCVRSIGTVQVRGPLDCVPEARFDARFISATADANDVRTVDAVAAESLRAAIVETQRRRDTIGGTFEVWVTGLPPGVGSHAQWDRRLDARLMEAVGSIQAVKGVEVGDGWTGAARWGSEVHDAIGREGPALVRPTNHAGGTEGGISTGEPIVVRGAMKPIATVPAALPSVDLDSGQIHHAHVERSDTCAVPAAGVVAESMVALAVAQTLLETWGADTVDALRLQVREAWARARRFESHVFLTGLSGAGKTTVGPLVAAQLERPFVDLDVEIVLRTGRSIGEIFASDGEAAFRQIEAQTLRELAGGAPTVIALGGGSLTGAPVRDLVRRSGDVVWLDAPVELLAERLGHASDRPLLREATSLVDRLTALRREREPLWSLCSDVRIDSSGMPDTVAQRVVGGLESLRLRRSAFRRAHPGMS